jgi:hypothetical protein
MYMKGAQNTQEASLVEKAKWITRLRLADYCRQNYYIIFVFMTAMAVAFSLTLSLYSAAAGDLLGAWNDCSDVCCWMPLWHPSLIGNATSVWTDHLSFYLPQTLPQWHPSFVGIIPTATSFWTLQVLLWRHPSFVRIILNLTSFWAFGRLKTCWYSYQPWVVRNHRAFRAPRLKVLLFPESLCSFGEVI